mmetsp:Transcript_1275/g.4303  ORF Transcript_1275/g.4303 Transcript_1275/m.4303 type:complete len:562 (-) Transcript_1275:90-1775(-)|eukprot:CAMPEP_0118913920 /NCGR_PEP_ID=MMETSP1166-20130328/14502_1 /TAXON_ID=1104430 /ORGANISM="Chrysoreinhardia sp, Strain CCMP3193" /LENGTH=561 /DNA_ID=CAMNT_0006853485 /DNA_START=16 /DNA_END=1701 /DNA_ORIENTATION=+
MLKRVHPSEDERLLSNDDADDADGEVTMEPWPKSPQSLTMDHRTEEEKVGHAEDTPAYETLKEAGVLCTAHRRTSVGDIFTGLDLQANTDAMKNIKLRLAYGCGGCCCVYACTHTELFVPAGHVGLLMDDRNRYLFASPGMHNIASMFIRTSGKPLPLRGHIRHGNRTIVIVEQGHIGYATDNGQPVLLPPGIHVWTSETLDFLKSFPLNDHRIELGPYTLLTVDEGYAAVTQNNGKQVICAGGQTHFLNHKNWRFEKFMTLKIQTDELQQIVATSADNINMSVTSTVNWRITHPEVAATMAAETMSVTGSSGDISADISKLRRDVLKQSIASLAGFIGSVNYSTSFHIAAATQGDSLHSRGGPPLAEATFDTAAADSSEGGGASSSRGGGGAPTKQVTVNNPIFDEESMSTAVVHANKVTMSYGVEILSINIISATPVDRALTTALASGAVASAEALQAETSARGQAQAVKISALAEAERQKIEAQGKADSAIIEAQGQAQGEKIKAEGAKAAAQLIESSQLASDLAKMDKSSQMLNGNEKFFFGQEPSMLSNIVLKGAV